jgi:hypothetical protein
VIHSSIPTDLELGVVELDPLSDQANRSPRDLSIENGPSSAIRAAWPPYRA